MSLLLDALKKAADDKQKALQGKSVDDSAALAEKPVEAGLSAESEKNRPADSKAEDLALELPDLADAIDELSLEIEPLTNHGASSEYVEALDIDEDDIEMWELPQQVSESTSDRQGSIPAHSNSGGNRKSAESENYVISDEALAMLISNTNREIKKGRRLTILSVFVITIIALVAGGFYYYTDTQSVIDDLERKHKIAMQAMKAKTNRETKPDNVEVIRNLVDDKLLADKVELLKKVAADKIIKKPVKEKITENSATTPQQKNAANTTLSIKKVKKVDIVAEKLESAWYAYESANYADAKQLYQEVLALEANNRDAILGLGAIAITENNAVKASDYYMSLLQQNPLDPIATAALANMSSDKDMLISHEDHLLSMIQKNPGAAPLHYALGNVYVKQQNWKSAQQAYFDAWQNDNDNADYIFNLAVSLDQLGKKQQALSFYQQSLKKSKNRQTGFSREAVKKRINDLSEI